MVASYLSLSFAYWYLRQPQMQHWFEWYMATSPHMHTKKNLITTNTEHSEKQASIYAHYFTPHLIRFSWKTKTQPSLLDAVEHKQTELDTIFHHHTCMFKMYTFCIWSLICHKVSDWGFLSIFWEWNISRQIKERNIKLAFPEEFWLIQLYLDMNVLTWPV